MGRGRPSGYFDTEANRLIGKIPSAQQVSRQRRVVAQAGGQPPIRSEQDLDRQLEELHGYQRSQAEAWISRSKTNPTLEIVNSLIKLSKESEELGEGALSEHLYFWASEAAARLCESAERDFRFFPSSENYARWWGMIKMCDIVGAEPASQRPQFRPVGRRIHVVASGDTLSRLARHYYGSENLWDLIYEANSLRFHPDWIRPGQRFVIP